MTTWTWPLGRLSLAAALGFSAAVASAQAPPAWPPGMSFVAQDAAGAWALYRVDDRRDVVRLATELEPRQACVVPDGSKAVYAAADGTLRVATFGSGGRETVLARPSAAYSYTQPCLGADGDLVAVEMAEGKSIETEIVRFGNAPEPVHIARQPGAQHDPYLHQGRWLVYASVGCSYGCEQLLVEIWSRDLLSGQARQLTLLNALSQAPVTDGRRVVFSSNASGTFQLWEVGLDGSAIRKLTDGAAQATQPAFCRGELYFVKGGPAGSVVARLGRDGTVVELPLSGPKSVRALRCLS